MSRQRKRPRPAPAARSAVPARITRGSDIALGVAIALAAVFVFRGTLGYFFAQDDFAGLARARGLAPAVPFPWRWLSGQFYFEAMRALAGLHALPYRAASLAAHAACVALVYRTCRRIASAPAASLGATFFGAHPSLYTALYSISGIGEVLAAAFALAALLAAERRDRGAWIALPLFAASLLAKESTLLLPLLVLVPLGAGWANGRRPVAAGMAALSVAYAAAFAARDVFGVRGAGGPSDAYAISFGRPLFENLLTYLGWTVPVPLPLVHSFQDAVEPGVFVAGGALAVVVLAGCAARPLRARGWLGGAGLYLLTLLPVLPLAHHTYHYYLYAPLAGAAVLVAALADAAGARTARPWRRHAVSGLVALASLALVVNGALLVRKVETMPFMDPELRADPTVDRARIAANAVADLRTARLPAGTRLWFWSPASLDRQRTAGEDTRRESYWESNVRAALGDGLAARVFVPGISATGFVREFAPAGDSVRYAVYLPDGHLRVATPGELAGVVHRLEIHGPASR